MPEINTYIVPLTVLLIGTVYIKHRKTDFQPVLSNFHRNIDLYSNWYDQYKIKNTNFTNKNLQKPDKCLNLLLNGGWNNSTFKMNGFSRKLDYSNKTHEIYKIIEHPYHPEYHQARYSPWANQNWTGTWESQDDCKIERKWYRAQLDQCFDEGNSHIMIVGDSRARQLSRAFEVFLDTDNFGKQFLDSHESGEVTEYWQAEIANLTTITYITFGKRVLS